MIQKPTISLHAPGVDVVLSNRAGRFVLMQGATGLGVAPRDLTVSDLPGGGGVLRHARSAVPRVTIPILLGGDYEERAEDRRTLERLSEGDVEIRVTQPDGESRSRTGVYVDGLDLKGISDYYWVLYDADPTSIGGSIPDDAFYYIP